MKNHKVKCSNFEIANDKPFTLIAGPCQLENEAHAMKISTELKKITAELGINLIYKTSFDKANRTSLKGKRGMGLEKSLPIFDKIREEVGVPVLTDIHIPTQASVVAEVVDVLQIPAFLCRQTDLLISASKTGKPVNVKKGQFLAPWDMGNVINKLEQSGCKGILLTDRGTQFGYNNLIADMRSIPILKKFNHPVIFDATHSTQLPGGDGNTTGGMREMVPTLAKAAVASGCNGLFMEIHDDINNAKSDASTQWPLEKMERLLNQLLSIYSSLI